jgi:hypothetical protein
MLVAQDYFLHFHNKFSSCRKCCILSQLARLQLYKQLQDDAKESACRLILEPVAELYIQFNCNHTQQCAVTHHA